MLRAFLEINWRNKMSWQERIERYQRGQEQERVRLQREKEEKIREEQEQQRRENIAKIKPLLQVLEDLECRKALTGIRDEIWKLGEVTVSPNLGMVTHKTPIEATASLVAFLGRPEGIYRAYNSEQDILEGYRWNPEGKEKSLQIKFDYVENNAPRKRDGEINTTRRIRIQVISGGYVWRPYAVADFNEESKVWLEKALLEDCVMRPDLPYDMAARKAQKQYDEEIKKDRKHYYTWERRK